MPELGLIGYPLNHSFSPQYFNSKFDKLGLKDWTYKLFQIKTIEDLPKIILQNPELIALNVTIPYKEEVIPFCEQLSEEVENIGATNLIVINRFNQSYNLSAYNTDCIGFKNSLLKLKNTPFAKALVMGTGGASKAIQYTLKSLKIEFDLQSRYDQIKYKNRNLKPYDLIINCTPIGTLKEGNNTNEILPLKYETVSKNAIFYDLVYNPSTTPMMQKFDELDIQTKNGLEMLQIQADEAWQIIQNL